MGGKRTDAISGRDLEVLEFIARFGLVPRDAVAQWAGTGRTATIVRERRLRIAGLVEVHTGIDGTRILVATGLGLKLCQRPELRIARFAATHLEHSCAAARVAARLEGQGLRTSSEREILALARIEGNAPVAARMAGGRRHRPDLLLWTGEIPRAVEVELTVKGASRLDQILRAWRRAVVDRRVSGAVYYCAPSVLGPTRRGVERTRTEGCIQVLPIEVTDG